jgi:hypothetical protein
MIVRKILGTVSSSVSSIVSSDPYWSNVVLLLNGDGTNGSNTILDLSSIPKTITNNGTANHPQANTTIKKYGTGSIYFNGSSYLTNPSISLSGDFTIECWVYRTSAISGAIVLLGTPSGSGWIGWQNSTTFYYEDPGYTAASNYTIPDTINTWAHYAVVRSSNVIKVYVNGVAAAATLSSSTIFTISQINGKSGSYLFTGYLDDLRVTNGIARYTTNFTPPTQTLPIPILDADPYWNNVILALNGDGTNGSTSFSDLSLFGRTVTPSGNTQVNTSINIAGTGSVYFDGAGDYLTIPTTSSLSLGNYDFTIELWFYQIDRNNAYATFLDNQSVTSWAANTFAFFNRHANAPTKFSFMAYNYHNVNSMLVSTTTPSNNTWYHLAIVRSGSTFTLYVNGISEATATFAGAIDTAAYPWTIGGWSNNVATNINGYLDNLRVTKGIARYTSNFTPVAYPLPITAATVSTDPYWSNVLLEINANGTNGSTSFSDLSLYARTITPSGNTQINTSNKIAGTGSVYFDGAGDYLTIPTNSSLYFGTSDFTIEMWYKASGRAPGYPNYPSLFSNASVIGWAANSFDLFDRAAGGGYGFNFYSYNMNPSSGSILASTTSTIEGVWYHLAVVRSGSSFKLFVNGISEATYTSSASLDAVGQPWTIGVRQPSNGDYITGYVDNLRVTKGVARYTVNFTPPAYELPLTADPYWINVGLLLNGNGVSGNTTFTDLSISPKSVSVNGTVVVDTVTKKYGTGSIYFNGSSYLTHTAFNLTADLTIECWLNRSTITGGNRVLYSGSTGWVGWSTNTNFVWSCGVNINFTIPDTTNTWAHYAIVRQNGIIRVYVNGQVASESGSTTAAFGVSEIIGQNGGYLFACYLDDLRVTNGIARYTINFTPPTSELQTI